ncbi:hypothetical protein MPH_12297 [Macrophomina phaseolina MS6]|uniref:BTB domain-containing protein n=1 Tax=Macrophomina phaseolina (strain MS6) TaxID=1126212 RepID=K2QLD4_MACPH|nr:hypothetical protein MPH_12297 [Macrophomina phaseolina MS6]
MAGETEEIKRPRSEHESDGRVPKKTKLQAYNDLLKHPVMVYIGQGSELFHCFAAKLWTTSALFRIKLAELNYSPNGHIPLQQTHLYLPNEQPSDFGRYREWMDKSRLWQTLNELDALKPCDLSRLFCFAERIGAKNLKNQCINVLYEKTRIFWIRLAKCNSSAARQTLKYEQLNSWHRAARWVANNIESPLVESALRRFFVDWFAYFLLQMLSELDAKGLAHYPNAFLWHVLRAINAALRRHVPGLPLPDQSPATNSTTTAMSTPGGGTAITVEIGRSPHAGPIPAPAHTEVDTTTRAARLPPCASHENRCSLYGVSFL